MSSDRPIIRADIQHYSDAWEMSFFVVSVSDCQSFALMQHPLSVRRHHSARPRSDWLHVTKRSLLTRNNLSLQSN